MASYSPVFSAQFILRDSTEPLPSYEVPSGFTAVIRDFSAHVAVAGDIVILKIQNTASAPPVSIAQLSPIGAPAYDQWTGRVVVPEFGFMTLEEVTVGDNAGIYVGGYLLRNVAS